VIFHVDFVVGLDIVELIQIIDHQPGGLPQAVFGDVGEPVEALQPRAVAEMKARDAVRRFAVRPGMDEIVGAQRHERFLQARIGIGLRVPFRLFPGARSPAQRHAPRSRGNLV